MIQRLRRPARRSPARNVLIATGIAGSLLVTACTSDQAGSPASVASTAPASGSPAAGTSADGTAAPESPSTAFDTTAPESSAAETSGTAPTDATLTSGAASSETGSQASSPAGSTAAEPTGSAEPNPSRLPEVTVPGTRLKLGESMIAEVGIGVTGTDDGSTYVRYTITDVEKGDQKILEKISDKGEYDGGTVYYVRGSMQVLAVLGDAGENLVTGAVVGVQDDGSGAAGTFGIGDLSDDCTGNFVLDGPTVGHTEKTCSIALAKKGTAVVGAAFVRDGSVPAGGTSDDPYYNNPVLWLP